MNLIRKLMMCCFTFLITLNSWYIKAELITAEQLVQAAKLRLEAEITYDGRYLSIDYPMGDVPEHLGVCTDVVIRSYRQLGIDLQQLVHEDMRENFEQYPKIWGLKRPDSNIDHRRVPNLEVFLQRYGKQLPIADSADDYKPGDLVSWRLPGNLPHIGIVSDEKSDISDNYLIIHNIGAGPKEDDILFEFPISGHFRFFPELKVSSQ
ncbi:MAG: DUF1287 domain-containing protein [Kangiellaceae bacterium]|nr:DUF1287 domain-containing protein [Kangiellaceae bacterium]